jgi:hypothetical protein
MSTPTPVESANLILRLYETRREETMRKARDFVFIEFNPASFEEVMAAIGGPQSGYIRMVMSYWDMAATMVNHKAIDEQMFIESAGGEYIFVFGKFQPYLSQMREAFMNPGFLKNLESLVMRLPNIEERLPAMLNRLKKMSEARKAAAATAAE